MGKIVFKAIMRVFKPPYRTLHALEEQLKELCECEDMDKDKETVESPHHHKYDAEKVKTAIKFARQQQIGGGKVEGEVIEYSEELSTALVDAIYPNKTKTAEESEMGGRKDGEKGTSNDLKAELVALETRLQDKGARIAENLERKMEQLESALTEILSTLKR
eukprot:TRINITY_DN163_c0_g1_i7.p2 TRINITY_DN163_c0_g1~~TRINITY_DN163_c0_g1_i7.p2  ORF type:complete len:162 (-),score=43.82 TRINITY_DN163_c0_g1_i7:617-1102(-)